ncbi:MAG: hypothetical protein P0Y66_22710 [Candidatus Kaistia colombiensis]|nr:MAG: hypothetical protein P0Y66_22710 [Kaistia sp.]
MIDIQHQQIGAGGASRAPSLREKKQGEGIGAAGDSKGQSLHRGKRREPRFKRHVGRRH